MPPDQPLFKQVFKLKIFALIEFTLPQQESLWERVTQLRDQLLEEIDQKVEKLVSQKTQIYQSIKQTGIFVEPEDSRQGSLRSSACRVHLDPEHGIVVWGSSQGVTSSVETMRSVGIDNQQAASQHPENQLRSHHAQPLLNHNHEEQDHDNKTPELVQSSPPYETDYTNVKRRAKRGNRRIDSRENQKDCGSWADDDDEVEMQSD